MRRFSPILCSLLIGCETLPPTAAAVPDRDVVDQAIRAARPGPLLELSALAHTLVPMEGGCPVVETFDFVDGVPTRERWTGGCVLSDGAVLSGTLEILDQDGEQWIAGDDFSVSHNGALELYLDGAIEAVEREDLLLVDASATWCGGDDAPCAAGTVTVDLSYSLFPADGYPSDYDVTVSGVVAPGTAITVEGSWSVDLDACDSEPTDGVFALRRGERHDLTLDGALDCDACAHWIVQGVDVPEYCGLDF
ncbi:MAG: hypothetical protein AAFV53_17475 [Myxococcota bacterium]